MRLASHLKNVWDDKIVFIRETERLECSLRLRLARFSRSISSSSWTGQRRKTKTLSWDLPICAAPANAVPNLSVSPEKRHVPENRRMIALDERDSAAWSDKWDRSNVICWSRQRREGKDDGRWDDCDHRDDDGSGNVVSDCACVYHAWQFPASASACSIFFRKYWRRSRWPYPPSGGRRQSRRRRASRCEKPPTPRTAASSAASVPVSCLRRRVHISAIYCRQNSKN